MGQKCPTRKAKFLTMSYVFLYSVKLNFPLNDKVLWEWGSPGNFRFPTFSTHGSHTYRLVKIAHSKLLKKKAWSEIVSIQAYTKMSNKIDDILCGKYLWWMDFNLWWLFDSDNHYHGWWVVYVGVHPIHR